MRKRIVTTLLSLIATMTCVAQKTMYIPQEWRNRTDTLIWAEEDPENLYTWSLSRSLETDNIIILWDNGYGSTNPSDAPSSYKVDLEELAQKCEEFYALESDSLAFVDVENSNLGKYKLMVLLSHTTEWVCYGSGYDYQVSALWISPWTCRGGVSSSVAHEVGHSFQYMCYCVDSDYDTISGIQTGFHSSIGSGGSTIWETTANWQALQSFPSEMFTITDFYSTFRTSHNYAFTHEWQRYVSYMFLFYLCDYYNDIKTIADIWNYHETSVRDFNQVLMDMKGLSAEELYKLHFEYALKAVTWDLDVWAPYRDNYIGNFRYYCVQDAERSYQVAYASAPQATGFNVIPLEVPDAGTEVSVEFTALASGTDLLYGDPGYYLDGDSHLVSSGVTSYNTTTDIRNFRLGYVALMDDGTRQYFVEDSLYCHGKGKSSATVSMNVPEGTNRLWLVVSPSPTSYLQHRWDENIKNDDQWPYRIKLSGTDLTSDATVYQSYMLGDRGVADMAVLYDLYTPVKTTTEATAITMNEEVLTTLGTAFQMTADELSSHMQEYSDEGPEVGNIMLYSYDSEGALIDKPSAIDGGYGYWFTAEGELTDTNSQDAALLVQFDPDALCLLVSQNPGTLEAGDLPVTHLALRYRQTEQDEAVAYFQVTVHVRTSSVTGISAPTIEYDAEKALPVLSVSDNATSENDAYYDLSGRTITKPVKRGIYIKNGRKVLVN